MLDGTVTAFPKAKISGEFFRPGAKRLFHFRAIDPEQPDPLGYRFV
jgi:hypothetical protein